MLVSLPSSLSKGNGENQDKKTSMSSGEDKKREKRKTVLMCSWGQLALPPPCWLPLLGDTRACPQS